MANTAPQSAAELYTSLHRLMDNGTHTENDWARLAVVCADLDKKDEALAAFGHVTSHGLRRDVQDRLADRGWTEPVSRNATTIVTVTEADLNPSTREKVWDAIHFLADGHVRMAVLVSTAAFPIVMAIGGLLTAIIPSFVMRLIAAIPAALAAGMVGAYGRHMLVQSLRASDDTSDLPRLRDMGTQELRSVVDFMGLALVFLLPGSLAAMLGELGLGLLLILAAAYVMPMATVLRFLRQDWLWLKRGTLWSAMRRLPSYSAVSLVIMALFVPALAAFVLTVGKPLFLLITVVGPLAAAPYFAAMRIMGLTLHYEGKSIQDCLTPPPAQSPGASAAAQPAGKTAARPAGKPAAKPAGKPAAGPTAKATATTIAKRPASATTIAKRPASATTVATRPMPPQPSPSVTGTQRMPRPVTPGPAAPPPRSR